MSHKYQAPVFVIKHTLLPIQENKLLTLNSQDEHHKGYHDSSKQTGKLP